MEKAQDSDDNKNELDQTQVEVFFHGNHCDTQ
jgi:hypothetical protein